MNERLWAMARRASTLDKGRVLTAVEAELLCQHFGSRVPSWYLNLLQSVPLVGCSHVLRADDGLPTFPRWMDAAGMISEDTELYPGVVAAKAGFVPVAGNSVGSGDPYFVKFDIEDPPLWQVFHDTLGILDDRFELNEHFVVAPSLSEAFARCTSRDDYQD